MRTVIGVAISWVIILATLGAIVSGCDSGNGADIGNEPCYFALEGVG